MYTYMIASWKFGEYLFSKCDFTNYALSVNHGKEVKVKYMYNSSAFLN